MEWKLAARPCKLFVMPEPNAQIYPVNRFSVQIGAGGGQTYLGDLHFHEVVLPEVRVERAGAVVSRRFTPLVLRRAVRDKPSLSLWMRSPVARDIEISVLDPLGEPAIVWTARAAFPVRWTHTPLNSAETGILMETLELDVEEFDRVDKD